MEDALAAAARLGEHETTEVQFVTIVICTYFHLLYLGWLCDPVEFMSTLTTT